MEFAEYQKRALTTDQQSLATNEDTGAPQGDDHLVVPLLGLVGEVGTLHVEYKKRLRDGASYNGFESRLEEELGDILWYVSNLASKFDLDLGTIANANLTKVARRWDNTVSPHALPDDEFEEALQLPRKFQVVFVPRASTGAAPPKVQCYWNGKEFGNELDDNAIDDDGYRYHDAFHLAYTAVLGWSPVARKFFGAKREGDTDRVCDGGRAKAYEEAISAVVYTHAEKVNWFKGSNQTVDYGVLKLVEQLTNELEEIKSVTPREWEKAILAGFQVWNQLVANEGGVAIGDLRARTLEYRPLPSGWSPSTEL
jgi:NTP pyrophosphatase (non-canonical NTP hydrolase)